MLLDFATKKILTSLRICNIFFTQMVFVGGLDDIGVIGNHIDQEDLISFILTLGDNNITGGSTQYFDIHGSLQKEIVFQHGNLQIGNYDNILHGVTELAFSM